MSIGNAPSTKLAPWVPQDDNLLGAAGDPALFTGTVVLVAGTLYLTRIMVRGPNANLLSSLAWTVTAAGVGASSGSFAGAYSPAGLLIAQSADIGAVLAATGAPFNPMLAPAPVGAYPFFWAALLSNLATTQPTIQRASASSASTTMGQTAPAFRFATNGTGLLALPASITPSANGATPNGLLAGWK